MSDNENEMKEQIIAAISEVTGRTFSEEGICGLTSVFELGIDSMGLVELVFALEARLGIDIPLTELNEDIFESLDSFALYLNNCRQITLDSNPLTDTEEAK